MLNDDVVADLDHAGQRGIALVAHDNKKPELLRWAAFNAEALAGHRLHATGTTGTMLQFELGLPVTRLLSGPVGGDQLTGDYVPVRPDFGDRPVPAGAWAAAPEQAA